MSVIAAIELSSSSVRSRQRAKPPASGCRISIIATLWGMASAESRDRIGIVYGWARSTFPSQREILDPEGERVLGRQPLVDAGVRCPHCGADAWEIVETRAERGAEYTRWRLVVCGSCMTIAHRWEAGRRRKHFHVDPELERELEAWRQELLDLPTAPSEVIQRAPFSVYGLDRSLVRATRIAGFESKDGQLRSVEVEHRARIGRATAAVTVQSSIDESWSHIPVPVPASIRVKPVLAQALDHAAGEDDPSWKGLSFEARVLRRDVRRRQMPSGYERAEHADLAEQTVPVDGSEMNVTIARDATGLWVALAVIGEVTITVCADEFDPPTLRLVAITDGMGYFSR